MRKTIEGFTLPRWFERAGELAKQEWARNYNFKRNAVYPFDPAANRKINKYIKTVIWPAAVAALASTRFRIFEANNLNIEQEWDVTACRLIRIVIEDPERPFVRGANPPWLCRLEAHCNVNSARLDWYFAVSLPSACEWGLMADLLAETSLHGCGSRLSLNPDDEAHKYEVSFEGGGGSEDPSSYLTLEERTARKLGACCDFIETVYELESDCNNRMIFRKLIREVNQAMII